MEESGFVQKSLAKKQFQSEKRGGSMRKHQGSPTQGRGTHPKWVFFRTWAATWTRHPETLVRFYRIYQYTSVGLCWIHIYIYDTVVHICAMVKYSDWTLLICGFGQPGMTIKPPGSILPGSWFWSSVKVQALQVWHGWEDRDWATAKLPVNQPGGIDVFFFFYKCVLCFIFVFSVW